MDMNSYEEQTCTNILIYTENGANFKSSQSVCLLNSVRVILQEINLFLF